MDTISNARPEADITDILDYFDIDDMQGFITDCINNQDTLPGVHDDRMALIWDRYVNVKEIDGNVVDDDTKKEVSRRFDVICDMVIDAIAAKFNLSIDEGWYEDINDEEKRNFTFALYNMFEMDLQTILKDTVFRYIEDHKQELYDQYGQNLKAMKDAAFGSAKERTDIEYAVIIANIYSICFNALDAMSEDQFFEYIDEDYEHLELVKKYYEEGHCEGEFTEALHSLMKHNDQLSSRICFDIISMIYNAHPKKKEGKK